MELQTFLQQVFACSPEVAQAIRGRARVRAYPPGAPLVRQGEPCADVYLLVIGNARAFLLTSEGAVVQLWDYGPGDMFGAVPADPRGPDSAEVAAISEVQAAIIRGDEFLALAEVHACIGLTLSQNLVRQLARATHLFIVRTTLSAAGRVYAELLRLAEQQGGRTITPAPVLSDLALRVQSTRETVSRTINALERRGIIQRDENALTIVAPARLEEMIA